MADLIQTHPSPRIQTAEIPKAAPPISVFILTKNEESNLPACLDSVKWSDDVHVLDSYSSDGTVRIAEEWGAKVSYRKLDSFSEQQNWALDNLVWKYPWVFYLDADERATPELVMEMLRVIQQPGDVVAFNVERRDYYMGRWLRHVQATKYYLRLFRPTKMRYERYGQCRSKPDGPTANIPGYLIHYPFSKGMADWYQRHNFYSSQEAVQFLEERSRKSTFSLSKMLFAESYQERQAQKKELFYRMPLRPVTKFLYLYFVKRGFLDGRAGFSYALLIAFYEYMIVTKTRELQHGV